MKLIKDKVCQVRRRCAPPFSGYLRKTRGGRVPALPPRVFRIQPENGGAQRRRTWPTLSLINFTWVSKIFRSGHVRSRSYSRSRDPTSQPKINVIFEFWPNKVKSYIIRFATTRGLQWYQKFSSSFTQWEYIGGKLKYPVVSLWNSIWPLVTSILTWHKNDRNTFSILT